MHANLSESSRYAYDMMKIMAFGVIYSVVNTMNGKEYVGQTTLPIEARWSAHKNYAKSGRIGIFYAAIRKYGVPSFRLEQIDEAESREELDEKESFHIVQRNTLRPFGYNIRPGGNGASGFTSVKRNDTVRSNMSLGQTIRFSDPKERKKISDANSGQAFSTERRLAIGNGRRQTQCVHGHQFTDDNLVYRGGRRTCKTCFKARWKIYLKKRREKRKNVANLLSPNT